MGSLKPAAIRYTLERLQESARRSGCFLIAIFKYFYHTGSAFTRYLQAYKITLLNNHYMTSYCISKFHTVVKLKAQFLLQNYKDTIKCC